MTHLSYHQNPQMKRYPDATDTVVFSSNPSGKTRLPPVKHRHSVLSHEYIKGEMTKVSIKVVLSNSV